MGGSNIAAGVVDVKGGGEKVHVRHYRDSKQLWLRPNSPWLHGMHGIAPWDSPLYAIPAGRSARLPARLPACPASPWPRPGLPTALPELSLLLSTSVTSCSASGVELKDTSRMEARQAGMA